MGSSFRVSLGGGAPGTLSKSHTLIDILLMAFRITYCSQSIPAQSDPSQQVVEMHWVLSLHSTILGDIIDCDLPVCSHCMILFCCYRI